MQLQVNTMSDNNYRILLGALILTSLYTDVSLAIFITMGTVLLEGVTNFRIPKVVNHLRGIPNDSSENKTTTKINFEAERAFRLSVSSLMLTTYPLGPESMVWFIPWFVGFAVLGAGVSGICPLLTLLRWIGLR